MKIDFKLTAISVIASALLVGCGSSTTSSTQTGYLIDAPVSGVSYVTTSGISGITDRYGKFSYAGTDSVTFSIGKLELGQSTPGINGLITPTYLVAGEPVDAIDSTQYDKVTLLLQTLQSLDSDNNTTNGIYIDPSVVSDLNDLNETVCISDLNETELIALDKTYDLGLDEDYDGVLDINATIARLNYGESKTNWDNGYRPDDIGQQYLYVNNGYISYGPGTIPTHSTFDLSLYPTTTELSQELKDALAHMGNEERLAHDIYLDLYNYHLNNGLAIRSLYNIATRSETQHVSIVQDLVTRYNLTATDLSDVDSSIVENNNLSATSMVSGVYDIPAIQDLYNTIDALGKTDQESALKVGCMVEVVDINDLDKYITMASEDNATDVIAAFGTLRDASYKHYWSFDRALKNIGVINGCYYEGDTLLTDKSSVYPK